MFRNKVQWYEEGEKNSKYFLSLEKERYNAKTCFKMINSENQEIIDQQEILLEQKRYYEELYKEDTDVTFTLKNNIGIYVPQEIKEQQITKEDLHTALKGMKNDKTPGEDGITADFYKVFWSRLKQPFYDMVLEVFQQKMLHELARKGILNLIPKPEKDTRYIKNLRPITLLNSDYKNSRESNSKQNDTSI